MLRLMLFSLTPDLSGMPSIMQSGFSLPWWGWLILFLIIVMMVIILIQGSDKKEEELEKKADFIPPESDPLTEEKVDPFSRNILAAAETSAEEHLESSSSIFTDDFSVIEGIGPKINDLLHRSGILTFSQLAETDVDELDRILADANFGIADPETWAEQAELAAKGDWEKLKTLQEELKGGRRVS